MRAVPSGLCLVLAASSLAGCVGGDPPAPVAPTSAGAALQLTPELRAALAEPGVYAFNITVDGEPAMGWIGVPANGTSDRLLVICHGYGGKGGDWRPFLEEMADAGVLAVAMDYRGDADAWKVRAGANDTIAVTLALQAVHPAVEITVLYGWSMGGEVSGMAAAEAPPGTFDYWLDGAGVTDLARFWLEVPGLRGVIEAETGGTPEEVPDAYTARSPAVRGAEVAAQGLARAYLVYAPGDFIVTMDHGEGMYGALVDVGVPVSYYAVPTNANPWVCAPVVYQCAFPPVGPAGHEVGLWPMFLLIEALLDGSATATDPAVRGVSDGVTGTMVPPP